MAAPEPPDDGTVPGADSALAPAGAAPEEAAGPLAALAAAHGLRPSAQRPTLIVYLRQLALRWNFIMSFATARNVAMYTEAKLGQLWQVLAPMLNAAVYFLIFGVIIKGVSRGVPDYLPFLVTGVFVFSFTQRTFISSSKVITDSLPLIRALQFPRASLPLAYVMIEFQQMLLSIGVLVVLVLLEGEPLTASWLLAVPALALLTIFNAGLALFAARTGARVNDFAQLLPFLMRTWLYVSGVIYSVQQFVAAHQLSFGWAAALLQVNPAYVFITLVRNSILASERASAFGARPASPARCFAWAHGQLPPHVTSEQFSYWSAYCSPTFVSGHLWPLAAGWAALMLLGGFWFFWRKEVNYGRG